MTDIPPPVQTRCCVVGGGPAGVMLGLLLARGGVPVTVLEKHSDFLRDFRGDTVHPSTLQVLDEIGLLPKFERLPQRRVDRLSAIVGGREQQIVDFRGLRPFPYLSLVPQWDFLDLLAREGGRYPAFDLRMRHTATGLIERDGRVVGVRAHAPAGPIDVHADLVVACDGRGSVLRDAAGLSPLQLGAPMDVLWFRIPRRDADPDGTFGILDQGHMMVLLNRSTYWQAAFIIAKGDDAALRQGPLDRLTDAVVRLAPFLADRIGAIGSWDDVATLRVRVDRLPRWHRPGLLFIGDAAHAMSPIGGVGINLAIQDAVATANALAGPLRANRAVDDAALHAIQRRREGPTRVVQAVQGAIQSRLITRALEPAFEPTTVPWALRALLQLRAARHLPARLFGYGLRREHVRVGGDYPYL